MTTKRADRLPRPRGQAMIEYSVVSYIILVAGFALVAFPMPGMKGPLLQMFWEGLNGHYESVYYVLQSSVP